jgi:caspase domain-containing protein
MRLLSMRGLLRVAVLLWAVLGRPYAQSAPSGVLGASSKSALLIGIDTYDPPGVGIKAPPGAPAKGRFVGGISFSNLKGPTHDVDAIRALLTSENFGFPDDDQHIHVLRDAAATRTAILAAMKEYLVNAPKAGDTVVLYISSHGSMRVNSRGDGQSYDVDGTGLHPTPLDNTIVPADAYLGVEDISNRELRRIFNQAADKGVHLTVILDACHSGGQARGADDPTLVPRTVEFDPRDLNMAPDKLPDGSAIVAPEDRTDNPVLVFSASQKDQSAIDVQSATPPHGLFTNALVQALESLPPDATANDVYQRVLVDIERSPGARDQQPALDSTSDRKQRPLFGGNAVKGPVHAAIVDVEDDDTAVLDIGPVADIGKGTEFTEITASNGLRAVLRITDFEGVTRSRAVVVSPAHASVHAKDIVELTKWVPGPRPTVNFYAGPTNLTLAQVRAAISTLRNAHVTLVGDPSSDPWTHILSWNGKVWILQAHAPQPKPGKVPRAEADVSPPGVELGTTLTSAVLAKNLTINSVVWMDAPLPSELTVGLLASNESAAQLNGDSRQALYVAAGLPTATGIAYSWYKRSDFEADVQTPPGFGRGCSPNSPYPLRTDWVKVDDGVPLTADPATGLTTAAAKLAKLNGWLNLESSVDGSSDFPYTLGLQRVSDKKFASNNGDTYKDERYTLTLNGSIDAITTPRWVYVLDIDCQGNGDILWPREGPGGRFPTDSGRLASIPLPDLTFRIVPPFGTDTYILLTTSTPLPDPTALSFEGVVKEGSRGSIGPLEYLLISTSSAARAAGVPTPTDWSIQSVQTHSHPTTTESVAGATP